MGNALDKLRSSREAAQQLVGDPEPAFLARRRLRQKAYVALVNSFLCRLVDYRAS